MIRRASQFGKLPLIPTLLVAAAAATMIALGFWQLSRAKEKGALLDSYAKAQQLPEMSWPTAPFAGELPLFRKASGTCLQVTGRRTAAGENRDGDPGYLHIADCRTGAEGPGMAVEMGWSKDPNAATDWRGGPVSGIIAPDRVARMRLVAEQAAPGLQPSARPSPAIIRNNHLSYAVQWFSFAAIALIIYGLALRQRKAGK